MSEQYRGGVPVFTEDMELTSDETPSDAARAKEAQDARQAYEDAVDQALVAIFDTTAGATVMDWLQRAVVEAPTFEADLPYEIATARGFAKEGQRNLVRGIRARIARAKG